MSLTLYVEPSRHANAITHQASYHEGVVAPLVMQVTYVPVKANSRFIEKF